MSRIKIVPSGAKAAFDPPDIAVAQNASVFWLNEDDETHQINLTGEELKRGDVSTPVTITAATNYFCTLHAGETGTIRLRGAMGLVGLAVAEPKEREIAKASETAEALQAVKEAKAPKKAKTPRKAKASKKAKPPKKAKLAKAAKKAKAARAPKKASEAKAAKKSKASKRSKTSKRFKGSS
jgi:hypothetical protein